MLATVRMIALIMSLVFVMAEQARASQGGAGQVGVMDLILLGVVVFILFRIFRRRSGRWSNPHDDQNNDSQQNWPPQDRHEQAKVMWDMLSSDQPAQSGQPGPAEQAVNGFDEVQFLEGAKMFFSRFQEAKDSGNWETVGSFIAPGLLDDLKREYQGGEAARSQIMLLEAKVMDIQETGGTTTVTVFFDALMRIGASGEQEVSERTAWEFSRPDADPNALWLLERINKVDH